MGLTDQESARAAFGDFVRAEIQAGRVTCCHDVSDGGVLVALAEMALASGIGASVAMPHERVPRHAFWFGEDQGRYLVTVPDVDALNAALAKGTKDADTASVGLRRIGTTGGDSLFGAAEAPPTSYCSSACT